VTGAMGEHGMTELRYLRRRANRRVRKVRLVRGVLRWAAFVAVQALLAALLVFAAGRALAGLERSPLLALRQIEIEGAGNRSFSDAGDSGSLIVDDEMLAAALLFAGGDHGGSNGKGLTYANPIAAVFKALKVKLA